MRQRLPRLLIVANADIAGKRGFRKQLEQVLAVGGALCAVQLRAHGIPGKRVLELAADLWAMTRRNQAGLWINDRIDVAAAVRADGVQLGSRSLDPDSARRVLGRSCWIGRSIHAAAEVGLVVADVYLLGNIFETSSHPERAALGVGEVEQAVRAGRPILGIGGITPERTLEVIDAGAWGVAVSSGLWGARDPAAATRRYVRALEVALSSGSANQPLMN
jgi:thiamine-phosphate diphosphorylase